MRSCFVKAAFSQQCRFNFLTINLCVCVGGLGEEGPEERRAEKDMYPEFSKEISEVPSAQKLCPTYSTGEPLRLVAHLGHRCWFCRLPSHQPSKHLSSSTPSQAFLEVSSHQLSPRDSSLKSLALPCPGFFLHLLVTISVLCFCSENAFRVPPFCLTFLLSILASLNLQGRHLLPAVIALQVPLKPDYPRRAFLNTWREAGVERHTRLHLPIHKHPFVPSLLLGQCLRWTW